MTASRISLAAFVLLSAPLMLGSSCAKTNGEAEPDVVIRDRRYDLDADSVWSAVLATYGRMELPIETVVPLDGRVRGKTLRMPNRLSVRDYMRCGSSGMLGDWTEQPNFKGEYSLSTLVNRLEDGGVEVKVRATYSGQVGANRMGCQSTGKLELQFFEALEGRLNTDPRGTKTD